MPSKTNLRIRYALGLLMLMIGTLVLVRLYVLGLPPKVGTKAVDTIFGVFFVLRGGMNLKSLRQRREVAKG